MPAHRKLLPRPCPQCGRENGGCQLVIFNPEFYEERTGYARKHPYCILRISHYSKEQYALSPKKNRRTKIWHNFQIYLHRIKRGSESITLGKIFDDSVFVDKQSITLPLSDGYYNYIKKHGWKGWTRIVTERAHWVNRNKDLKKCQECDMYIVSQRLKKFDYPDGYRIFRILRESWLCESCYTIELEKVAKWKKEKLLIHEVHA